MNKIFDKYGLLPLGIPAILLWFFIACNNTPAGEETVAVDSSYLIDPSDKIIRGATNVMSFSRSISGSTVIRSALSSGDTMIITYTPSSYVASKLDTVIKRKASVPVSTPPVDTVITPEPSGGYTGYKLVYSNDYEKGTILSSNQCGRCNINTLTPITGTGSFEAWYQAGDAAISSGYRSEQQLDGSLTPTDKGIIIEYDQRFDIISSSVQGLSMQVHGTQSGTSGNMGMWISGGQYVLQLQKSGVSGSPNTYSPTMATINQGETYHIKIEVMFSAKSTGYVRAWINGQKKWDYSGIVCDGRGQYPKPGLNLFNNKVTVKTSIDNFRIYNEL